MGIFGSSTQGQPRYSGELHNLQVTESTFGTVLPIVIGTARVHGKLLDYNGFAAVNAPNSGGKGIFGGKGQIFDYSANVAIALAQGPCGGLLNIWDQQGKLQNETSVYSYTIPPGGGSVTPQAASAPKLQADLGVTTVESYSVSANDYGSPGATTLTGTQVVPLNRVATAPGPGEYNTNVATGTYTFSGADAGKVVAISYSCTFSLYYFEETQAAEIPLSGPYTVSTDNQTFFQADNGVTFVDTGVALTAVPAGTTPSTGQYNEDVGFYTFAAADAGRYVYIKYTYFSSDPDITNQTTLNLTFFNGAQGQAPWPFFVSNFPASAFGYTGICYIGASPMAMGESPTLPSYNYELMGLAIAPGQIDADLTQAIITLLTDPLCGIDFPAGNIADMSLAQAYWGSNGYFISDCLTTQQSVAQTIKGYIDAGNVGAVWSNGQLKFIPYGDTTTVGNGYTYTPPTQPAAVLTWDDILPFSDGETGKATDADPIQISRTAPQDAMNYMQVEWTNRENDYNIELTPEQNDAFIQMYGRRMEGPQSWHWITQQSVATWAINLRLKKGLYKRNGYKFNLGFNFSRLEPMDIVVLPTGESIRITEIEDNDTLQITAEQFSYGSADVTIYPKQVSNSYQPQNSQALPGNTSAYIFEATPQSVLAQPNTIQLAVAGDQASWGGCQIYVSQDGDTYSNIGEIISSNRVGLLSAALPSGADPDTTDTLSIDMTPSGGELITVTQSQADNFVTLCAIVDQAGTIELVSYETASLTAANRYNLTYLRRGVYGTTIGAHSIGTEFAYLGSDGVFEYQYPAQYVRQDLFFKFPSFNLLKGQLQDLSACKVYRFTVPGTTLQPPSSGAFTTTPSNPLNAFSDTAGHIVVSAFTASLNNLNVSCLSSGSFTISGLNIFQSYDVYYVDTAFAGGSITPIATQNPSDYLGKAGYYLIGSITTPSAGATVYSPSTFSTGGSWATTSPANAYDSDPNSFAGVGAQARNTAGTSAIHPGNCTWLSFPNITPSGDTLFVSAAVVITTGGTGTGAALAQVSWDNGTTWTTIFSLAISAAKTSYTVTVPGSTNLDAIQVKVSCSGTCPSSGDLGEANALIYDIHIQ